MSGTGGFTLDGSSSSSTTSTRGASAGKSSRSKVVSNLGGSSLGGQDLCISLNTTPSPYVTVTNVTTSVRKCEGKEYPRLSVEVKEEEEQEGKHGNSGPLEYGQGLGGIVESPRKSGLSGGSYCGTSGGGGTTGGIGTGVSVVVHERGSIVMPVSPPEVDPFVVTVRNSPNKLGKSNSSSFISKNSLGGFGSKTGPRLALYRSNSSLDLLDRENYYLHHHGRGNKHIVHGGGVNKSVGVLSGDPAHSPTSLDRQSLPQYKSKSGGGEGSYTGCFTRRKDFGSHGSIDVLANNGGQSVNNNNIQLSGSGQGRGGSGGGKTERSSSLGNHGAGHFLSLVSSMSRDRRGSFDVSEESIGGNNKLCVSKSTLGEQPQQVAPINNIRETASPRLRLKFQKLWEHKEKTSTNGKECGGGSLSGSGGEGGKGNGSGGNRMDGSIFRVFRGSSSSSRNNSSNTKNLPESGGGGGKYDMENCGGSEAGGSDNGDYGKPILRNSCMEERFRRRVFAHYDCQSVSANISYAARLRGLLSKRRNTTTGASAASLGNRPVSTPPSASLNNIAGAQAGASLSLGGSENPSLELVPAEDPDLGDGNSNHLILSCPYFRNEVGGEGERMVCLSKFKCKKTGPSRNSTYLNVTSSGSNIGGAHVGSALDTGGNMTVGRGSSMMSNGSNRIMNQGALDGTFHRSAQARGISQLEYGRGVTHWTQGSCPYSSSKCPPPNNTSTSVTPAPLQFSLEAVDLGACYYQRHFYGQDHENWFGSDEILGPLAISIKRERTDSGDGVISSQSNKDNGGKWMYRLIVRSTELNTLRGAILEESIPGIKSNSSKGGCHAKEVIEFLLPEIQLSCLKLGLQTQGTEEQLLKLDQQILTHRHKVGIMYCKAGQATEEEMYNNEEAGPAFNEFLDLIGEKIRLKGFDKYTGGLDNKDDSTGLYSVHSEYQDCDVIFHVSTLLPFTANNRQQLMRKRHIGNDIVTIVFQEPGALPFTPKNIRSQFQHVFVVVRVVNPCSENTCYSVSVSRSKEVPLFGPPIPEGGKFSKNKEFVNFLLAKVINAENATYRSEKFTTMATRTRQEYLKDLVNSYSSNTSIDPRPKFSMLPFGNKKKELGKPGFNPDPALRGALSWAIYLDDNSSNGRLDAYLGISVDSMVIIDSVSRETVFAIPTSSILGWSISMCNSNSLRIYYHQGECVTVHNKELGNWGENDDLLEMVKRLEAVTRGCETEEFSLRRNELGQLGFHVQQDGVVTEVENCGFASKAGLKQGSRLVEICKVAVATLSQDEMIDHLKTSNPVNIMVVPPLPDGSPRRGCDAKHCVYMLDLESEYENLNLNGTTDDEPPSLIHHQFKSSSNGGNSVNLATAASGNHRKRYEPRSFSPPRSSNSSGYGTGSSSKSFSSASDPQFPANSHEGEVLTSSSSGMSSTDDRWYDLNEQLDNTNGVNNGQNSSPPPIPARNANNANRVLLAQQQHQAVSCSLSASPLTRPVPGTIATPKNNDPLSSAVGLNNVVGKGSGVTRGGGASPPDLLSSVTSSGSAPQFFQNETSVVVVNNLSGNKSSVNGINGVVGSRKDNNSSGGGNNSVGKGNNVNGNGGSYQSSSPGVGIYMRPKLSACITPVSGGERVFGKQRDYFQRSNPHHGSFHMKLSPSRSHDLLHLKSTYGMNHGLKAFTNGGLDDYGGVVNGGGVAVAGRMGGGNRLRNGNDAEVLYQHVNGNGGRPAYYNSPLIENTVKGKVTYLTDFPLTHSQSSEYLVGCNGGLSYSNYESPMQKDINALKNERLALLKSTYLEKQREKHLERVDNNNEVNRMQQQYSNNKADSISGEIGSSQDELCVPKAKGTGTPSSRSSINSSPKVSSQNGDVKMRQHGSNNSTPRSSANRNSTLQEDLIRLIAPELISPSEEQDSYESKNVTGKTMPGGGVRPGSSNSAGATANLSSLKSRPMSCGSEPGQASSNAMIAGKISPARAPLLASGKKSTPFTDRAHGGNGHAESLYGVKRRLEQQVNDEQGPAVPVTVPIPLLPDSEHLDWSTLVDTATKAFQCCDIDVGGEGNSTGINSVAASTVNTPPLKLKQSTNIPSHHQNSTLPSNSSLGLNNASGSNSNSLCRGSGSNNSSNCSTSSLLPWIDDVRQEDGFDDKSCSSTPSADPVFQFNLEARVSHLEAELRKEQHSRQQLAATVANLQHENRILRLRSTSDQSPLSGSSTNKIKMESK